MEPVSDKTRNPDESGLRCRGRRRVSKRFSTLEFDQRDSGSTKAIAEPLVEEDRAECEVLGLHRQFP